MAEQRPQECRDVNKVTVVGRRLQTLYLEQLVVAHSIFLGIFFIVGKIHFSSSMFADGNSVQNLEVPKYRNELHIQVFPNASQAHMRYMAYPRDVSCRVTCIILISISVWSSLNLVNLNCTLSYDTIAKSSRSLFCCLYVFFSFLEIVSNDQNTSHFPPFSPLM